MLITVHKDVNSLQCTEQHIVHRLLQGSKSLADTLQSLGSCRTHKDTHHANNKNGHIIHDWTYISWWRCYICTITKEATLYYRLLHQCLMLSMSSFQAVPIIDHEMQGCQRMLEDHLSLSSATSALNTSSLCSNGMHCGAVPSSPACAAGQPG